MKKELKGGITRCGGCVLCMQMDRRQCYWGLVVGTERGGWGGPQEVPFGMDRKH